MRKTFCQALLLLSSAMFLVAVISKGLLDELLLMLALAAVVYVLIRVVRWLFRRVAPLIRWLVVLAFFAGLLYMASRELLILGGNGLLVGSILFLIIWAVLCPTNPKRARA